MKKPNFFIIGAPKCGTTSLAAWLSEHPNVYMSPEKEPHYFSTDLDMNRNRTLRHYESLFKKANNNHIAIGEASTHYLYSKVAVQNIYQYTADPKFIVMIRNPVEMAYSLHEQRVYSADEHIKDFSKAWQLQEERKKGNCISKWCVDSQFLQYGSICKLGEQLERLFRIAPRERVLIVLMDDMKQDTQLEYRRILDFLNLPDEGRFEFPIHNPAKERKSDILKKIVKTTAFAQRRLKIPSFRTGILRKIDQYNKIERGRKLLSSDLISELKGYFHSDIYKLSNLLGRDLTNWVD